MRKHTIILLVFFLITGCGKSKNDPVVTPDPAKATLTFPTQNSACTTGTVVSSTQSSITFTWNSSANTDSYELNITNLLNGTVTTQTSTTNKLSVNLLRSTPYSWFVVSKSNGSAAHPQSDTWKFYNSGPGVSSYAPFPADPTYPTLAQTVTATNSAVTLSWTGSDPDNDIAGYDIYFGTSNLPVLYKNNVTATSLVSPAVLPGNTYYWKIVTRDSQGNSSTSNLFQFSVK